MCQPRKWLWGLLPLLFLGILAGYWHQSDVEADLSKKGSTALAAAGLGWGKVVIAGRDAVILGEAPSPDARTLALKTIEGVEGVRRAGDGSTLLAEAKPFTLTALRDGAKITLSGNVPSAALRETLLSAVKKAVPGVVLVDETRVARGATAEFGALASYGLTQLGRLSQGTLSLSDNIMSLSGRAADFDQYTAVRSGLTGVPAGGRLAKGLGAGDILPPLVKPFTLEAVRNGTNVLLSGHAPSPEARLKILSELQAAGLSAKDGLRVADGAPIGDWAGAIGVGLRALGKLEGGKLTVVDEKLSLSGKAREGVTLDALRAEAKALPAGFTLGQFAVEEGVPPAPKAEETSPPVAVPFLFEALRGEKSISFNGVVPDDKTRTDLLDVAKRLFEGDRLDANLAVGPAAKDAGAAIMGGLQLLSRLGPGASLQVDATSVRLKGLALFDAARDQVAADFKRIIPPSFSGTAEIGTAAASPAVAGGECQVLFNEILESGTVRFRIASATLSDESRGILDKLAAVALRCGSAKVEIGGHTDADGAPETNADLSRRRAEAVAIYFTQAGIPAPRLEPVGYGETRPLVPNDSAANKAKNRRIEFVVK
jgi:OOP family OmpA-OmpF porin